MLQSLVAKEVCWRASAAALVYAGAGGQRQQPIRSLVSLNTLLRQCWLEQAAKCKLEAIGGTMGRAKVD